MDLMKIDGVMTMDSRDIAEITWKDHSNVCRDIRGMVESLGGGFSFESSYLSASKKYHGEYGRTV